MSRENPFSPWYDAHPQFTKDAGTLAFGLPLGQRLTLGNSNDNITMAGLMVLHFTPTVGYSADLTSPVNRAALQFFTYLRSVQKAASRYDVADVMMYFMAVDSLYTLHAAMTRAYKTAQLYTPLNMYYPRRLLQMQDFDPSISNNLAEFRALINRFGISLSRFPMPAGFDITNRHTWMCEGLYLDSNTSRAQTYMFVPHCVWQFDNTQETGGQLNPVYFPHLNTSGATMFTLESITQLVDDLVNALINDEDTGRIAGDIITAYGTGALRHVSEVTDMAAILPVYSQEVLSQIENCTICGYFTTDNVIKQNPSINNGAIIYTPTLSKGMAAGSGNYFNPMFDYQGRIMNMHVESPTPEQVIEATRLMATSRAAQDYSSAEYKPDTFGADIINDIRVGVLNPETGNLSQLTSRTQLFDYNSAGNTIALSNLQLAAYLQQFDWSPLFLMGSYTDGVPGGNITQVVGDVDNLTYVSASQLFNMHEAAMYSLFNVPQVGSKQ